jgi:hypothetical protein
MERNAHKSTRMGIGIGNGKWEWECDMGIGLWKYSEINLF